MGYLFNSLGDHDNEIYNEKTDTLITTVDVTVLTPIVGPRQIQWSGKIEWSEIPIDPILERVLRIPLPDVSVELGIEKGHHVYKFRINIRVDTVTIQSQREVSRILGILNPTNKFEWRRSEFDNIEHTRSHTRICIVSC